MKNHFDELAAVIDISTLKFASGNCFINLLNVSNNGIGNCLLALKYDVEGFVYCCQVFLQLLTMAFWPELKTKKYEKYIGLSLPLEPEHRVSIASPFHSECTD